MRLGLPAPPRRRHGARGPRAGVPEIDSLGPAELAYCGAVLLFTFGLRGTIGFGGAVGLPLLALALPVKVLAPAWSLIGVASSLAILGKDRRYVDLKALLGLLPGCALGIAAGLFLFKALDAVMLARALGVFVIAYGFYSFFSSAGKLAQGKSFLRPLASFLSGAVGTMFGSMASVFFAIYLDAGGADKNVLRATLSAMLMTLSIARTVAYTAVGEMTVDALILAAAILPAMGIGLVIGDRIHTGLSQAAFKRVAAGALVACGIALLLK